MFKRLVKRRKGLIIFLFGLLFNLLETLWFGRGTELGFNATPMSKAELVCDYIAIGIMVAGIYLIFRDAWARIDIKAHNVYFGSKDDKEQD